GHVGDAQPKAGDKAIMNAFMSIPPFTYAKMAPVIPSTTNQPNGHGYNSTSEAPKIMGSIVSDEEREHLNLPTYRIPTTPSVDQHPFFVVLGSTSAPPTKRKHLTLAP
ncbi:hypothetical protein TSMEX_011280, partial [Taenia solium]